MIEHDIDEDIDYLRWWAHPEQDGDQFVVLGEHKVAQRVLAELDRRGAELERVREENAELRKIRGHARRIITVREKQLRDTLARSYDEEA